MVWQGALSGEAEQRLFDKALVCSEEALTMLLEYRAAPTTAVAGISQTWFLFLTPFGEGRARGKGLGKGVARKAQLCADNFDDDEDEEEEDEDGDEMQNGGHVSSRPLIRVRMV